MTTYRIFRKHFRLPPCFCIGPRSFQADRSVPATDTLILPEREFPEYEWRFQLADTVTRSQQMGRKDRIIASVTARNTVVIKDQIIIDYRFHSPDNFAHFLSAHIPLLVAVSQPLNVGISDIKVILPQKVPGYISGLVELFGLDAIMTDHPVEGRVVTFDQPYKSELRFLRRQLLEQAELPDMIARAASASERVFAGKYFVARRGTRSIENHEEISTHLAGLGYETVFMEDLPLIDQFKLMQTATSVVGIHGAGLAGLFYANRPEHLSELVEIQPVGLASTFFRELVHTMGVHYVAVRGRLKRDYVPAIYDTIGSYLTHQNDTFSVDVSSVDQALDFARRRAKVNPWFDD